MDIRERLQSIFRDVLDDDEIVLEDKTSAVDIEDWDSLNHVMLIVTIEKSFNVKFLTQEVLDLKNVGEFIALLKNKLSGQ